MKKTVLRVIPYGGFDIPGLEGWLGKLAGKGLQYSMTLGPLVCFHRAAPRQMQVHLEPIQGPAEENPDLNALYASSGWEYWGMFRNEFYVFATGDLQAQAHTDPDTLDYALRKFFRQKLLSGLALALLNFLLLSVYYDGAIWDMDWAWMRYAPVAALSDGVTIPFLLSLVGFGLLDLSYLLGLVHLTRYRWAARQGRKIRSRQGIGWLVVMGSVILLPAVLNLLQIFAGLNYSPYDLEGSGFVTLTEIEGEDFRLSGNPMYNMDHISHGGTLLDPERWYFQQYASFHQDQSPSDVPRLEVTAVRYPLEILAQMRAEEFSRTRVNGSTQFVDLGAVEGVDQVLYAHREAWTHTNELTGKTRVFLPGGALILQRGNTVLYADYYGEQNLPDFLPAFVRTLNSL